MMSLDHTAAVSPALAGPNIDSSGTDRTVSLGAYRLLVTSFVGAAFFSRYDWAAVIGVAIGTAVTIHLLLTATRIRWWGALVLATSLFWTLYGLAVHSLPGPDSFVRFISTEGRVLVASVPLVALSCCTLDDRHLAFLGRFLTRVTIAFGVLLVLHYGGVSYFSLRRAGSFIGLTSSHHAAGYLAGLLLVIQLTVGRSPHRYRRLALVAIPAACVLESGSRSAFVGLGIAGVASLFWRIQPTIRVKILLGMTVAMMAAIAFIPRIGDTVESLAQSEFQAQILISNQGVRERGNSPLQGNILRRVNNWSDARANIADSPILGIGAWRYDDIRYGDGVNDQLGIHGLWAPYVDAEQIHGDGHAHNVYLHLAAETGLVGLALSMSLWIGLAVSTRRRSRSEATAKVTRRWLMAAWCGIGFGFGVSLTDIGLINPALTFLLWTVTGSALAWRPPASALAVSTP